MKTFRGNSGELNVIFVESLQTDNIVQGLVLAFYTAEIERNMNSEKSLIKKMYWLDESTYSPTYSKVYNREIEKYVECFKVDDMYIKNTDYNEDVLKNIYAEAIHNANVNFAKELKSKFKEYPVATNETYFDWYANGKMNTKFYQKKSARWVYKTKDGSNGDFAFFAFDKLGEVVFVQPPTSVKDGRSVEIKKNFVYVTSVDNSKLFTQKRRRALDKYDYQIVASKNYKYKVYADPKYKEAILEILEN